MSKKPTKAEAISNLCGLRKMQLAMLVTPIMSIAKTTHVKPYENPLVLVNMSTWKKLTRGQND